VLIEQVNINTREVVFENTCIHYTTEWLEQVNINTRQAVFEFSCMQYTTELHIQVAMVSKWAAGNYLETCEIYPTHILLKTCNSTHILFKNSSFTCNSNKACELLVVALF
jgi:hypothetical protein